MCLNIRQSWTILYECGWIYFSPKICPKKCAWIYFSSKFCPKNMHECTSVLNYSAWMYLNILQSEILPQTMCMNILQSKNLPQKMCLNILQSKKLPPKCAWIYSSPEIFYINVTEYSSVQNSASNGVPEYTSVQNSAPKYAWIYFILESKFGLKTYITMEGFNKTEVLVVSGVLKKIQLLVTFVTLSHFCC